MDSDNDYTVAKGIVQSGQSDEDWDALRQGKGSWPEDERKCWKQYRKYSLDKLIEMMESFKQITGAGSGTDADVVHTVRHTFALKAVPPDSHVLQGYVDIGNRLKASSSSGMDSIETGVAEFVSAVKMCTSPAMFSYLDGSSGLGKTQLAFALKRKVLYLPLGGSQSIYDCFKGVRDVLKQSLAIDMHVLRAANIRYKFSDGAQDFSTDYITLAVDNKNPIRLCTVSLLLKMLELFASTPAHASYDTNVFLSPHVPALAFEGMTLADGWNAATLFRDVLIHIDEVPMRNPFTQESFLQCLLLRNIIRCMGLPCLLSGTESTLLDVFFFSNGSRREGSRPWVWLMTSFPATILTEKIAHLREHCRDHEKHLLQNTRPLFIEWFAHCHSEKLTGTDTMGRICLTPETLTEMKHKMVETKHFLSNESTSQLMEFDKHWLHASTLLVFADSLQGSGEVTSSVPTSSAAQVGAKRSASASGLVEKHKKQKIADDRRHHTLLIRKHFALLYISPSLVVHNCMTELHADYGKGVCGSDNKFFEVRAAFKRCTEDPLLYLAGLRNGLVCRDLTSPREFVSVPSSYAFRTFRTSSDVGNSLAKSNDGTALEAECMAALVLAAHRYTSFSGTPFFRWLALVVAELSPQPSCVEKKITDIPEELKVALQNVLVPLLSPPNSPWGNSMDSGINFGNLTWCKNQERRDASAPLSITKAAGSSEKEDEEMDEGLDEEVRNKEKDMVNSFGQFPLFEGGYTALGAEFKDVAGFGGKNMATFTTKVANNSICLLIGSNLSDWKKETVQSFAPDVSVYRMNERGAIVCVTPPVAVADWQAGRKVLIALNLKKLYPERIQLMPHAT